MPAAEFWLLVAGCVACVVGAGAAARIVRRHSVKVDQWMPEALKGHTLAYSERTFRSGDDRPVVARVDRAYRAGNGLIVLVELKTRQADRVHLSDIIELSAQRVALEGETGSRWLASRGLSWSPKDGERRIESLYCRPESFGTLLRDATPFWRAWSRPTTRLRPGYARHAPTATSAA